MPVHEEIVRALADIEERHHVRVVYACESGSRAWGFASPDSDYDPRFIYVHPPEWYLSIVTHRDVIEEKAEGDLDLSGWELRKALRLFRKSNPPMLEWLVSPIVYREDLQFIQALRGLHPVYYSPRRCFKHYLSMARGNARSYLAGESVWLKKYFYVLRPLLACLWIERGLGPIPVPFSDLCAGTIQDPSLQRALDGLVARKVVTAEEGFGPRIPEISDFIQLEMKRLEKVHLDDEPLADTSELDRLFRKTVGISLGD